MGGNDAVGHYASEIGPNDDFLRQDAMKPPDNPTLAPLWMCESCGQTFDQDMPSGHPRHPNGEQCGPVSLYRAGDRFTPEEANALSLASQGLDTYCWRYGEWYAKASVTLRRMLEGGRNAGGTGPRDVDSMARPVAESSGNGGAVPDIADPVVAEDTPEKLIADLRQCDTIMDVDELIARVEALFAREREWRHNAISGHIRATQSALDQLAAMTAERDRLRAVWREVAEDLGSCRLKLLALQSATFSPSGTHDIADYRAIVRDVGFALDKWRAKLLEVLGSE
jgi:hypothetical protein